MSELNIFEQASRTKVRFQSVNGIIATEDLWSIPLTEGPVNLNILAIEASRDLREAEGEEIFVPLSVNKSPSRTQHIALKRLKLALIKHVIATRLAERDEAEQARVKQQKKQELLAALEAVQADSLKNKTPAELQAMIDAL